MSDARDRRAWWTGAIAAVAAFFTYVVAVRPPHYDEGDAVFARIAYDHAHPGMVLAETVAVFSMLAAYAAAVTHLAYVLTLRAVRVMPLASAALVTLAAFVMLASTALYMLGMSGFAPAQLRWILPAELVAAAVLAVAGVQSWRIARRDRARW